MASSKAYGKGEACCVCLLVIAIVCMCFFIWWVAYVGESDRPEYEVQRASASSFFNLSGGSELSAAWWDISLNIRNTANCRFTSIKFSPFTAYITCAGGGDRGVLAEAQLPGLHLQGGHVITAVPVRLVADKVSNLSSDIKCNALSSSQKMADFRLSMRPTSRFKPGGATLSAGVHCDIPITFDVNIANNDNGGGGGGGIIKGGTVVYSPTPCYYDDGKTLFLSR